jgi:hypothetical protein
MKTQLSIIALASFSAFLCATTSVMAAPGHPVNAGNPVFIEPECPEGQQRDPMSGECTEPLPDGPQYCYAKLKESGNGSLYAATLSGTGDLRPDSPNPHVHFTIQLTAQQAVALLQDSTEICGQLPNSSEGEGCDQLSVEGYGIYRGQFAHVDCQF